MCDGKAFYDANISDDRYVATYDPGLDVKPIAIKALCSNCAETHEIVIVPKNV